MARRKEVPPPGEKAEEASASPGIACLRYTDAARGRMIMGVPTTDIHEVPAEQVPPLVESGLYVLIPDCSHGE